MGRCPELKSDEFCDANVIVIEIMSHLCLSPKEQIMQFWRRDPRCARVPFRVRSPQFWVISQQPLRGVLRVRADLICTRCQWQHGEAPLRPRELTLIAYDPY